MGRPFLKSWQREFAMWRSFFKRRDRRFIPTLRRTFRPKTKRFVPWQRRYATQAMRRHKDHAKRKMIGRA
jgi:hypothetical protein